MGNKTLDSNKNEVVKMGEKFNIILYSNKSARRHFSINLGEFQEYITLIEAKSKYLGKKGECGSNTEHKYIYKAMKKGNIKIKISYYFNDKEANRKEEYNIAIIQLKNICNITFKNYYFIVVFYKIFNNIPLNINANVKRKIIYFI